MPAILHPTAQRINADTAGLTHAVEANPGQAVGALPHELANEALPSEWGGLHHLFSDNLPSPSDFVQTAVVKPTSSLVGKLGGLIPQRNAEVPPGPVAATAQLPTNLPFEPAPATSPASAPGTVRWVDLPWVQRGRKWLGF